MYYRRSIAVFGGLLIGFRRTASGWMRESYRTVPYRTVVWQRARAAGYLTIQVKINLAAIVSTLPTFVYLHSAK